MASKYLVIVESPAKARTISKFLGKEYTIEASIGHIRDLPQGAKEMPEKYRSEPWAYLGVNVEDKFEPIYIVPDDKKKQVSKLKALLKDADELYLATDEDREGEAISWHLCQVLKPKVPVHRLVFHEITKDAILESLKHPREIDEALVRAQESRRILDRLYGYDVSPLLWRKIGPKLSAGRVQSVAVRLIVDRERARMAFRPATYWDLTAVFRTREGQNFEAGLTTVNGKRIPTSRDFDPTTGKLKNGDCIQMTEAEIRDLLARLQNAGDCRVANVEDKTFTQRPPAPFTTSTLQQEANRKHGFSARRTMQVAQSLYENGRITYMRTDSTTLSSEAINAARSMVRSQYGEEYLPASPRQYQTKVKNAQEAHEAIRPAGTTFATPEQLRLHLSEEEYKLYDLIWKRAIASQMLDAEGRRMTISVNLDNAQFSATGKTITFPGYLRAYVESFDDMEDSDGERILPPVKTGDNLDCRQLDPKVHTTQPPNRYSEAALTRTLEEKGIGRPSTYASIIDTILARNYVFKRGNVLIPTWMAFAVCQLLETHLPNLIDYQFTAEMEDELDAVSRGEQDWLEYLHTFYFGDDSGKHQEVAGLKPLLANKLDEIDARAVSTIEIGVPEGGGEPLYVRVGRYGPYLEQGDRRMSLPDGIAPDEMTVEKGMEMLDRAQQGEEPLGFDPATNKPVFVKVGRFGPYIQCGTADDAEKPVNVSLLKGMDPETVDLETALKLLALPRTLGNHPENGEEVVAANGRYGPYIKCGNETRSLPDDISPIDVTMEQALELLSQPKAGRGRAAAVPAKSKEPLATYDVSPVTGTVVTLLSGRFGPYVTDGKTNASLPRTVDPSEVTMEVALELLAVRAAKGPAVRKRVTRKKAAPKKTAKKTVKKATAKKKTVKKAAKKTTAKKTAAKKTTKKASAADAPFDME